MGWRLPPRDRSRVANRGTGHKVDASKNLAKFEHF
jgi:hypothetical protein